MIYKNKYAVYVTVKLKKKKMFYETGRSVLPLCHATTLLNTNLFSL